MNFGFMTSIFLFHDKNTSINDKSIISEKVYFCNVNFTRHLRRQIHQSLSKNRLNLSLIYDAEHSVILTELQSALRLFPHPLSIPSHSLTSMLLRISGKFLGIDQALLPSREWNQKQKHKKPPWSKVECFAFGGATVRFASLETVSMPPTTQSHPPPSYEGYPLCPKDKNRSPFHGEKPLITTWFLDCINSPKRFCMVGTRYFASAPNDWYSILYHNYGRTWSITSLPKYWFFAEGELFLSFWRCHRPPQRGRRWWCGVADSSLGLKSDMPQH